MLTAGIMGFYLLADSLFPALLNRMKFSRLSKSQIILASVILLVALRYIQNFLMLGLGDEIFSLTPDGATYFSMARDILNGKILSKWDRTVGTCLLYVPVMWFTGKDFPEVGWYVALINGFVLMPACSIVLFFIFNKILKSWKISLIAGVLWIVLPFFTFSVQDWNRDAFFMVSGWPEFGFSWRGYGIQQMLSFNNLIDAFSAFTVFGSVALAMNVPGRYSKLIFSSVLFGFACLVRVNNVMLAPVIAFLFWESLHRDWRTLQNCLLDIIIATGAFIFVFDWQLILNKYHFDSLWIFPSSLTASFLDLNSAVSREIYVFFFGL